MSTTTLTPNPIPLLTDSMLADSYFNGQPGFPSIRSTPTVKRPVLNKVYFSKKVMTGKHKVYDPNGYADIVRVIWEIPFSVDVNEPVTELTQKIQAVMVSKKIYKHWDINMNTFTILASEETNELDYIRA